MNATQGDRPDEEGHELLVRLLDLSPEVAAQVRAETPPRVRPRRQVGPSADYGTDELD